MLKESSRKKIENCEEKIKELDERIEKASNEWNIENTIIPPEEKHENEEIELCYEMQVVISIKEYEEIYNYSFSCGKKESEEESLMKLRVFWATYLNGDLNDERRLKILNDSHFAAMEILKDIEKKI
jgi:hypothetical protein